MGKKDQLLGMPHGTAAHRLRKMLLWSLVVETEKDICFHCDERISNIDDLSIEHKEPWESALDPKVAFFDLQNITFSHLSCNSGAPRRYKERCPAGHTYNESRRCKKCQQRHRRQFRQRNPKQDTRAYRRAKGWSH